MNYQHNLKDTLKHISVINSLLAAFYIKHKDNKSRRAELHTLRRITSIYEMVNQLILVIISEKITVSCRIYTVDGKRFWLIVGNPVNLHLFSTQIDLMYYKADLPVEKITSVIRDKLIAESKYRAITLGARVERFKCRMVKTACHSPKTPLVAVANHKTSLFECTCITPVVNNAAFTAIRKIYSLYFVDVETSGESSSSIQRPLSPLLPTTTANPLIAG